MYIWDIADRLSFIHRDNGFKHCRLIVAGGGGNGSVRLDYGKQSAYRHLLLWCWSWKKLGISFVWDGVSLYHAINDFRINK